MFLVRHKNKSKSRSQTANYQQQQQQPRERGREREGVRERERERQSSTNTNNLTCGTDCKSFYATTGDTCHLVPRPAAIARNFVVSRRKYVAHESPPHHPRSRDHFPAPPPPRPWRHSLSILSFYLGIMQGAIAVALVTLTLHGLSAQAVLAPPPTPPLPTPASRTPRQPSRHDFCNNQTHPPPYARLQ